jgi:glycosyltransferase involved in cell wall biosynthesis
VRILILSNFYPPRAIGGYERMCRDVAERFRERGHEVGVLSSAGEGVRLYWGSHEVVCPPLLRRAALERANQRALRRALRSLRPNVVSVWGMGCLSLGLLTTIAKRGLPVVYVVGDDWLVYGRWADCWTRSLDEGSTRARLLGRLLRIPAAPDAIGATGAFCFVSEFTRVRAEEMADVDVTDASIVSPGIDVSDFPLAQPGDRPWRGKLLCVGRVVPQKGFDAAIRVLAGLVVDTTLTIVGPGGPHRDELRRLAVELGVAERVFWTDIDRSELRDRYREADALLFPSTGAEAFGLVPLEAMACATPVVATAFGGSAEYLSDGENCLVVPPGNPEAIEVALARLKDDPALRRRIVEGGLNTAARFTVDRFADALERVHAVAEERAKSGPARSGVRPWPWRHRP